MVCSAWNPNQINMMALPPCHWGWNVVVYGEKLNLIWHQRSCDLLLGVGANIASYGLLLMLLAKESGLKPGELVGTLADCHIYENHMNAARKLIERTENELPELIIENKDDEFSIFNWTYDQANILNYNPHEKLEIGAVTV
jgi:thymidylate synthase